MTRSVKLASCDPLSRDEEFTPYRRCTRDFIFVSGPATRQQRVGAYRCHPPDVDAGRQTKFLGTFSESVRLDHHACGPLAHKPTSGLYLVLTGNSPSDRFSRNDRSLVRTGLGHTVPRLVRRMQVSGYSKGESSGSTQRGIPDVSRQYRPTDPALTPTCTCR